MHNLRPNTCLFLETIAGLDGQGAGPMHHLEQSRMETKIYNERLTNLFLSACVESGSQVVIFFVGPNERPYRFPHKRAFHDTNSESQRIPFSLALCLVKPQLKQKHEDFG